MEKRIILQSIEPLLRNNYALKLIWNELVQTQIGKKKKKIIPFENTNSAQ